MTKTGKVGTGWATQQREDQMAALRGLAAFICLLMEMDVIPWG